MTILENHRETLALHGNNVLFTLCPCIYMSDGVIVDFQVTQPLPNVTFELGRSFAGNIAVNRPGHPNNSLFFWAFEKENGSLTAGAGERSNEPWGLWLNGGYVVETVSRSKSF